MSTKNELAVGFSENDKNRIETHLEKLLPYLEPNEFALVGGIPIRYHLINRGIDCPIRALNDLDMIAKRVSVVSPSVRQDFLIYHYHPQTPGHHQEATENFYLVLVDPKSRTKIDIFCWDPAPERLVPFEFRGHQVNLVSVEDQLVKTVVDISRISEEAKVDPKQFSDAKLLLQIADLETAERYWKNKFYEKFQKSLLETTRDAQEIAEKHPEWLKEKPFRKPQPYVCPDCNDTPDFPLTPMEEIYRVLGYIE